MSNVMPSQATGAGHEPHAGSSVGEGNSAAGPSRGDSAAGPGGDTVGTGLLSILVAFRKGGETIPRESPPCAHCGTKERGGPLLGAAAGADPRVPPAQMPEVRCTDAHHRVRAGATGDRAHPRAHRRADAAARCTAGALSAADWDRVRPGACDRRMAW